MREKLPSGQVGQAQPGVPLTLALVYEAGTEVHSQEILQVQSDTQLVTNEHGRAHLKVRQEDVLWDRKRAAKGEGFPSLSSSLFLS